MSKQRFIWADSLKGWLMLLVILGHAIQSTLGPDCYSNHVWNLIYSFHMPAFMAVSGWLAYRATDASKPAIVEWGRLSENYSPLRIAYLQTRSSRDTNKRVSFGSSRTGWGGVFKPFQKEGTTVIDSIFHMDDCFFSF